MKPRKVQANRRLAAVTLGVVMLATGCSSSKPAASSSSSSSSIGDAAVTSSSTTPKTFDYSTKLLDPPRPRLTRTWSRRHAARSGRHPGTRTITREDAVAHGTPDDKTPAGLAVFPNTFTATLKNGQFTLRETSTSDVEAAKYVASPGHLVIDPTGSGLTADSVRDADGTIHLTAVPPILDPGGVFILTTKPWTPVR